MKRRESSVKLTFADRVRGWFSPEYAARAPALRLQAALCRDEVGYGRTSGRSTRIDNDWSGVQYGPEGLRDLSPGKRMEQVKRSRKIDQENMLGSALLDRAVDNIIGEDMVVQPRTDDEGWNRENCSTTRGPPMFGW